jgi:hypothetical protein
MHDRVAELLRRAAQESRRLREQSVAARQYARELRTRAIAEIARARAILEGSDEFYLGKRKNRSDPARS